MKAHADKSSIEFKRGGITVLIRPTIKDSVERFVLDYRANGQRKLVWRSTLKDAKAAAGDAIDRIVAGQAEVLQLTNADHRVAECADVPRVSDECGNSPQMIRQHYLRRVKPAEAARWFAIAPLADQSNVVRARFRK